MYAGFKADVPSVWAGQDFYLGPLQLINSVSGMCFHDLAYCVLKFYFLSNCTCAAHDVLLTAPLQLIDTRAASNKL